MFIKPLDLSQLPPIGWNDKAGNTHFILQSKTASIFNILGPSKATGPDAKYKNTVNEYNFRILLTLKSRKQNYVIAVDNDFNNIRKDWNLVEKHLDEKLNNNPNRKFLIEDQLDTLLYKVYDQMGEQGDPIAVNTHTRLSESRTGLAQIFKNFDDTLLGTYQCTYGDNNIKGKLTVGRNGIYYYADDLQTTISIPFREFNSIELINSKRMLGSESIEIGHHSIKHTFVLNSNQKQVLNIISLLTDAAMNRLITIAENSLCATFELFAKGQTGDLGTNIASKAGGLLLVKSRTEVNRKESIMELNSFPTDPNINSEFNASVHRYTHIQTSFVNTIEDLENQARNIEFRTLFRLPYKETIQMTEHHVQFYQKSTGIFHNGQLFISQNFVCFAALPSSKLAYNDSHLFDNPGDPPLIFVVPFSHIVSITKHAPTALTLSSKTLSFSGYLLLSTKNKKEFWLTFPAGKKEFVSTELLSRIKQVDWLFDGDMKLGANIESKKGIPKTESNSSSLNNISNVVDTETKQILIEYPLNSLYSSEINRKQSDSYSASWLDYFQNFGDDICMIKQFSTLRSLLVQQGLNENERGDFWATASGAVYSKPPSTYYQNLVYSNPLNLYADEIERDLHRSIPEHPAFQDPIGIGALRRVLLAFSRRNQEIGYAQALNIISAVLLLNVREVDAFWLLCVLVENMLPDNYTKTLVGSVVDQQVFSVLVQDQLPELYAHFNKINLDLSTVTVQWFIVLFLNTVSLENGARVLDLFFLEGSKVLFWMALSVLELNESKLKTAKDDDIAMTILKNYFDKLDIQQLFNKMITQQLSECQLQSMRRKQRIKVVHKMEKSNKTNQTRRILEQTMFSETEAGILYDYTVNLAYFRAEWQQNPEHQEIMQEETNLISNFIERGGWGLAKHVNHQADSPLNLRECRILLKQTLPQRYQGTSLVDRIFVYSSLQFYNEHETARVDLGTLAPILDVLMKQPIQTRLGLFFNLYDVNADGNLDTMEVKAAMDDMMIMFANPEEEGYMHAFSSFVNTALKLGVKPDGYALSFNEFLMSVLGQTLFVSFFDYPWPVNSE